MSNIADENELPDDFFNDLADSKFVNTVVENPSNAGSEDDEQMTRCLAEIDKLQKDIERRKKKILKGEAGLSEPEKRKARERRSHSRSRSKTKRDRKRNRSRSRESSPSISSSSRLIKRRTNHHDRNGRSRSRSRSPRHRKRSSSVHKNLTFLEELERTFAEKGQSFPEKDLLLNQNNNKHMAANTMIHSNLNESHIPMGIDYGNVAQFNQGPSQAPYQPSLVSYPIQQQNLYYGINPMAVMAGNVQNPTLGPALGGNRSTIPVQFPVGNVPQEPHPNQHDMKHVQMFEQTNEPIQMANQNALIERCEHAMKLVRAKDNRVPVLKFLFNRTSTMVTNSSDPIIKSAKKSPLHQNSPLNVAFKLNAQPNVRVKNVDGIRMLPKRVKDVCTALSIDSTMMFDKLRLKEVSNQIADQLIKTEIIDAQHSDGLCPSQMRPIVETVEISTQTKQINCEKCTERHARIMVNVHSQTIPKTFNIGIQTDEKDYREPIVKQLSQMTAAQLVAIRDFADIITEPRPQMAVEMYRIRERLMDIYNLSQRDADAVRIEEQRIVEMKRIAEERRMADMQRITEERRFGEGSSIRNRSACDMYPDQAPKSPPFTPNFDSNDMIDGRGFMMDDRGQQQRFSEERQYQSRISMAMADEQRLVEEQRLMERERMIERERLIQQREEMLVLEQRREQEILMRQLATQQQQQQQQQQQHPQPFENDMRDFNRADDRLNFNSSQRGGGAVNNRRGRGAFRDNGWARGNRR